MNATDIVTIVNIHTGERLAEVTTEDAPAFLREHGLMIVGILPNMVFLVE